MGRAWADRPGLSLPQVFATPAQQKGAYRLLSNSRVTEEHVLDAHRQSTVDRCRLEPVVLAVQDTTMLNYSGLATSEGLAALGGGGKGVKGLPVHLTLAVTPTGRPLGVLEMDTRFRPPAPEQAETSERTRWLAGLDCAAELAKSCPDTRVIAVCDREADMFPMLERAAGLDVELLFRSSRGAKRTVRTEAEDSPADLWERLASQPVSSILELDLPASGGALQLDTFDKRGGDVYYTCMQLGLRHFGEASLTWFKEKSRDPSATRWSLARGICEREDWRNRQGEWCIASACKALPQLAAHLGVTLPAARPVASVRAPASDYPDLALDCALEELGEVSVRRVAAKDVGAFRRLLHTHHPLGWDRSPGTALNCWIVSSRQGRLGGVRWSAAGWHQACRDRWIGWSEAARVAHLQAVVRQSRFLILPGVRVPNLASHVLAKASKVLAAEWRRAHGTAPMSQTQLHASIVNITPSLVKCVQLQGPYPGGCRG